ncbi:hypothetical protein [Salibacterium salarium]|nr:hypothetical protein [Salibacterium salarium]
MLAFSGSSFSTKPFGGPHEGLPDAGPFGVVTGRGVLPLSRVLALFLYA